MGWGGLILERGFWQWDGLVLILGWGGARYWIGASGTGGASALGAMILVLGGESWYRGGGPGMERLWNWDEGWESQYWELGAGGGGPSTAGSPYGRQWAPRGNRCCLSIAQMERHPSSCPPPPNPGDTAVPELPGAGEWGRAKRPLPPLIVGGAGGVSFLRKRSPRSRNNQSRTGTNTGADAAPQRRVGPIGGLQPFPPPRPPNTPPPP